MKALVLMIFFLNLFLNAEAFYTKDNTIIDQSGYLLDKNTSKPVNGVLRIYYQSRYWFSFEKLKAEITYRSGMAVTGKSYYNFGSLESEVSYDNGKPAQTKLFYGSGELKSMVYYQNGQRLRKETFYKSGKAKSLIHYTHDEPELHKTYYETGVLKSIIRFNNGEYREKRTFYTTGAIKEIIKYKNSVATVGFKYSQEGDMELLTKDELRGINKDFKFWQPQKTLF